MNLTYIKKIGVLLLLIASIYTKTYGQTSTYTTGTAPYSFSFTNSGNNTAYTTQYVLVNTTTNLIAYTSSSTNFSSVVAGVYELFAINYTGTTPTLTVGTDFRNIGGSCIAASTYQSMLYVKTGTTSVGTVTSLTCGTPSPSTATTSTTYTGTETVSYTGGNAGTYTTQSVASTGITGLTATLSAGTLASGAGSVTYTIAGTPSGAGTATFAISLGGQSCSFAIIVNAGTTVQDYNTTIGTSSFGQFAVGASKSYTVNFTNTLSTAATNTVTAQISSPFGWTCTGCSTITIPALTANQTYSVTISLTATNAGAAGFLTSNITTASGGDSQTSNNAAVLSTRTVN